MIKLLLVSDSNTLQTIQSHITKVSDIEIVAKTEKGEDAIPLANTFIPDVILIDNKLSGIDSLTTTHKILRRNPKIKILILTSLEESASDHFIFAGSQGYLSKKVGAQELITAIRQVYAGQIYLSPDISQIIAMRQITQSANSPFCDLSQRELQVMTMIAHGMRIADIANKLCLSSKTINTYRYRLFEKLNVKNNVNLTHLAMRYGILET